ncbi:MAG: two-component system, OmpR family, phosphate regulon response regulator PhoB [Elusimicrobia bacterium]|nr:MAG: two-component system, OmpR family, phosphate regulon response regulator PhoB [Elusimicrobiota bacterium]
MDDAAGVRSDFAVDLEREGLTVETCANPETALLLAESRPYDAFVLDIMITGHPLGHHLISRLRDYPRTAKSPILAMTGFGDDLLAEALRRGANASVDKADFQKVGVPLIKRFCREARAAVKDAAPILIVEDDEGVAALAEAVLLDSIAGPLSFETASTPNRALSLARSRRPRLILLDLQLAGEGGGLDLLGKLKADPVTASVPVIAMTASKPDQAMRACFDAGAMDYICKPLRRGELEARARKALGGAPLRWGPLHLDHATRRAFLAGRLLDISPKELAVLRLLIKAEGRTVETAEILRDVWDVPAGTALETHRRTLLVHMSMLRRKLGVHKRLVKNVHGVGYRLAPPGT